MGQQAPLAETLTGTLSGALGDLMASTGQVADRWAELDADTVTVAEAGALLEGLDRQINRLQGARSKLAASFARREGHRTSGHKDLAHWMQDRLRRSPRQARKEAKTAERLTDLSATRDALDDGDISLDHAAAVAEQASKSDDPQAAQRCLLAEARTSDPGRVRKAGRRLRRDQDRRAEDARKVARARQQRTLTFRTDEAAKTMWIEGRLPLVDGVKARAAVDALAAPAGRDDDRSYGQRMADGLVQLAGRATTGTSTGTGTGSGLPSQRGVPVEVLAVVPVDAIEGRAGVPAGTICGTPGGGIDLSDAELRQLLEDARLSWLIVDPAGVPLRYGKTIRFATTDQRRVLRARDGGCAWPGCDAPGVWALAHHEPPYDHPGGATDIDTQALFCDVHHQLRHRTGWTVHLDADATITVTSPDGTTTLTETATRRRTRHATWELSATPHHGDDLAHETPATYRTGRRHVRAPPTSGNGTVGTEGRWHPRCRRLGRSPPESVSGTVGTEGTPGLDDRPTWASRRRPSRTAP